MQEALSEDPTVQLRAVKRVRELFASGDEESSCNPAMTQLINGGMIPVLLLSLYKTYK